MKRLPGIVALAAALSIGTWAGSEEVAARIRAPGGDAPSVLSRLAVSDAIVAVALDPRGNAVAAAYGTTGTGRTSEIRVWSPDRDGVRIAVTAEVRDVVFDGYGTLWALAHEPAEKREGETYLLRVNLARLAAPREMRLPPSARSLAWWPERSALLVAARDEVRALLLPGPRTGPQFRIPGDNLAVAAVREGLVLVGQHDRVSLFDLDEPSGREPMEPQAVAETTAAVASIVVATDGSEALARLADDRLYTIELSPFSLVLSTESVRALVHAPPSARRDVSSAPIEHVAPSESVPAPSSQRTEIAPPPASAPARTEVAPTLPDPVMEPTERADDRADEPLAIDAEHGAVRGTLSGPAANLVDTIVLAGPNHVAREAARIEPRRDGTWAAGALAPGRYRVTPQSRGAALRADPPFQTVDVRAGETVALPELRILDTL